MRNHRLRSSGLPPYKISFITSAFGFTDVYESNQYNALGGFTSWQINTQNIPNGTVIYATIEHITTVDENFGCDFPGCTYQDAMRYACLVQNNSTGLNWRGRFNGLPDSNKSFYVHFRKNSYTGEIFHTQQFTWYDSSNYFGQSATNYYLVANYGPTDYDACVNIDSRTIYIAYIPYGPYLDSYSETLYNDAEGTSPFTGWLKFDHTPTTVWYYSNGTYAGSSVC